VDIEPTLVQFDRGKEHMRQFGAQFGAHINHNWQQLIGELATGKGSLSDWRH
jgi:hypothetical protein